MDDAKAVAAMSRKSSGTQRQGDDQRVGTVVGSHTGPEPLRSFSGGIPEKNHNLENYGSTIFLGRHTREVLNKDLLSNLLR
jgi:hypothetical protein